MKESLKPRAYKQSKLACGRVTACLLKNEPASYSPWRQVKPGNWRSRSESESEQGDKSLGVDPKPGELPMARVKRG